MKNRTKNYNRDIELVNKGKSYFLAGANYMRISGNVNYYFSARRKCRQTEKTGIAGRLRKRAGISE